METKVQLKYLRIAPRKVAMLARSLRGKLYSEAERELMFAPQRSARPLLKLLRHAKTNLVGKAGSGEGLRIKEIRVDHGPSLKRWQPRARGMASLILKRSAHVALIVSSPETIIRAPSSQGEAGLSPREHEEPQAKIGSSQRREERAVRTAPSKAGLSRRIFRRKSI